MLHDKRTSGKKAFVRTVGLLRMNSTEDTNLLTQADPRPRIERKEYERVRGQVLLKALVDKSVRVEFER